MTKRIEKLKKKEHDRLIHNLEDELARLEEARKVELPAKKKVRKKKG